MSTHLAKDMNVVVFNVGSSSLSFKLYRDSSVLVSGKCHRVGVSGREASYIEIFDGDHTVETVELHDHRAAAAFVLDHLERRQIRIDAAGHRFADGGAYFTRSVAVTLETRPLLERCVSLAPLHNAAALNIVDLVDNRLRGVPQYVVFDSTFHATLPEVARTYALPAALADRFKKHGFHGLSYADVLAKAQQYLGENVFKAVVLHLGTGGSSACAIADGRSIDTSMGYSPLQGLVMNTRCGDLDPGILVELVREGYSAADLTRLLHHESGLFGLSGGLSADIRDLMAVMNEDTRARLAFELYVYRAKQYVGAYTCVLNGIDVLIFTDDVGLSVPEVRSAICRNMDVIGIRLDDERNAAACADRIEPLHCDGARVRILAIPNDEESVIYDEGLRLLGA